MSLDQNLFTLNCIPTSDPNVLDLVDPSGRSHYRKRRLIDDPMYKIELYDPHSEALLATASGLIATSKHKTLELCNPTSVIELKFTGTLSFKWSFSWEDHQFEWKREECFLLRKPDPPVLVALTKEPAGKIKTISIQILDYNLNRFDVEDRKGLEIAILTALMTFQDYNAPQTATATESPPPSQRRTESAPLPPPKPPLKTGLDRVAELQAIRGEVNEVTVEEEGSILDYAQYCSNLLQDHAMLFITVRSATSENVPKVLSVVEEAKRIRHKAGLSDNEGLHQYVLYDANPRIGSRRINLDADAEKGKSKYAPPNDLTIHLSKIPMPELQPRSSPASSSSLPQTDHKHKGRKSSPPRVPNTQLTKPPLSSSTPTYHVPSHQTHPYQPSPSPSQLRNPLIYVAPPPPRPSGSGYAIPGIRQSIPGLFDKLSMRKTSGSG